MTERVKTDILFKALEYGYIDQVMEMEQEAYPEPWPRHMFVNDINNPDAHFYVAFLEGRMIGYVSFQRELDEAHITTLTVHSDFRGRGFGRRILLFILNEAAAKGADYATLEVRETNHRAQNLYMSMNFMSVGRIRAYYPKTGEDAIVMECSLVAS